MDLTISAPSSIPSGAPGTERREARVPGTARVVGRCCIPTTPSIARVLWRLPAGCCCVVMAWSSATCSCGRPCFPRSEEHTSELQSHVNLVCRLLLEKKNAYELDEIYATCDRLSKMCV